MKRKVLFLIESLAGGGAEKVLTTLVQHIDKTRFDVTVCTISGGGKYEAEVSKEVKYLPLLNAKETYHSVTRLWYNLKYHFIYNWLPLVWIYRFFIPKGNDVEVAFVEGFATKLLASSTNNKARKLSWLHCDFKEHHWTKRLFNNNGEEYLCYKTYDQIITMSKTQKDSFLEIYPNLPVQVCNNPIDSEAIIKASQEEITLSKRKESGIRIISIGRLSKVKAYDRLLRIVKQLKDNGYEFELWLLGQGEEKNKLEEYISKNKMEDVVKIQGFQSNPYKYLTLCDLFVCSSISEGFSTAITEALILGLPVISTEVSGVKEQLTNGCGIITDNNEEALYEGIKYILDNPSKLSEMKDRAIERGKDFRIETLMKEIEALLS